MTTTTLKPSQPVSGLQMPAKLGRWPLGVLPDFQRDPLGLYTRAMLAQRDLVAMRFGPRYSYALFHPDYIKHVLVDNQKNYNRNQFGNDLLKQITGLNLLTSDGDFWLRQRRLIQPAFHRQRIAGFGHTMTQSAAEMLERWAKLPAGQMVDISKEIIAVTLHVVGRSLFSVDLLGDSSGFGRSIEAGSAYFAYRLGRLFAPPLWVPTKINREYKAAGMAMLHLVPEMIAARRRLINEQGTADESGRAYDMLDLLLETRYEDTGEPMNDEQLDREIRLFIAAGHETTSNTLTWTLYLLSQHPEAERKLHAEIDTVLGGRAPSMADLPKLPYTKQVIEESMRLYPAAWIVARQSIAEDQLGPYHVPANQGVVMPIYAIHRHPDYWPEAERFDPERFAPENAAKQHKYAYFPFGGGPRMCIVASLPWPKPS